jgi:hypothetical protein
MPIVAVSICDKFSAAPGTKVQWTNIPPSGCTISQDGLSPWPFNIGPPIVLPPPSTQSICIKEGLPFGTYCFVVSCCKERIICVTVT